MENVNFATQPLLSLFNRKFTKQCVLWQYVKPEAATATKAPDDGRENARNMLSCT